MGAARSKVFTNSTNSGAGLKGLVDRCAEAWQMGVTDTMRRTISLSFCVNPTSIMKKTASSG
ncbi:MAG: hypothetical protein LBJ92_02520 [Holosporales bacterium]|nr:hypothetical protein [Holosporales bacterium]